MKFVAIAVEISGPGPGPFWFIINSDSDDDLAGIGAEYLNIFSLRVKDF